MKKRLVFCCACGAGQVVAAGKKPDSCGGCGHDVFHKDQKVVWQPFARGHQSRRDARFLKSLRIMPTADEDQPAQRPIGWGRAMPDPN